MGGKWLTLISMSQNQQTAMSISTLFFDTVSVVISWLPFWPTLVVGLFAAWRIGLERLKYYTIGFGSLYIFIFLMHKFGPSKNSIILYLKNLCLKGLLAIA